jgi:hypothetical protein
MIGGGVDGVWGAGRMMVEGEELAVIPFVFKSVLISLATVDILSKLFIFSAVLARSLSSKNIVSSIAEV